MTRILLALLSAIVAVASTTMDRNDCNPEKMTVYKVVLHTYWTREKFPKHYPDWRPPAQWSKMYGLSHDKSYVLFRLGQRVSPQVRQFAESGRPDSLDMSTGASTGLFDIFVAPAVDQGAGRTDAEFFLDGNHSRVSIMARMIPSPDWFVGVDSFDLCMDGNWVDSITIEVDPIDAGTDNGFTFTAPNWPTAPQGVAYRITSKYPSHPAGSFFYPHLRRLPPIATFQFIKLREYELTEVFHRSRDDQKYDVVKIEKLNHNRIDVPDGNRALNIAEEVERNETPLKANDPDEPRIYQGPPRVYQHEHGAQIDRDFVQGAPMPAQPHYSQQMEPIERQYPKTGAPIERMYTKSGPRGNALQDELRPRHNQVTNDQASKYYKYAHDTDTKYDSLSAPVGPGRLPQREPSSLSTPGDLAYSYYSVVNTTSFPFSTDEPRSVNKIPRSGADPSAHSALRSLARQYREKHRRKGQSDYDPAERRKRKKSRMLDCKVSSWDAWSPCRSDGGCVGTAMRTRTIIHREKPGGKPCPPTTQSRWCAANCTGPQTVEDWRNNVT